MWVPIIVPIVALLALGSWLALVYYAAAHPQNRHASAPQAGRAGGQAASDTVEAATRQEVAPAASVAPAPSVDPAASAVPSPADGIARDRAAHSGATAHSATADSSTAHSGTAHSGAPPGDVPQPEPAHPGRRGA